MTKTAEEETGTSLCERQTGRSSIVTPHFIFQLSGRLPDLKRQVYFGDSETQMNAQTRGISSSIRHSLQFKTQWHNPSVAPVPQTSWKSSDCTCPTGRIQHAGPSLWYICWPRICRNCSCAWTFFFFSQKNKTRSWFLQSPIRELTERKSCIVSYKEQRGFQQEKN